MALMGGSRDIARTLLDAGDPTMGDWSSTDLRALLEHQLRTPLRLELEGSLTDTGRQTLEFHPELTFHDVLKDGQPEGGLLTGIKEFAKDALTTESGLPGDIARVLYVAALLRARSTGAVGFTTLDNASINREARRCLTLTWLPESARDLLRAGLGGA